MKGERFYLSSITIRRSADGRFPGLGRSSPLPDKIYPKGHTATHSLRDGVLCPTRYIYKAHTAAHSLRDGGLHPTRYPLKEHSAKGALWTPGSLC